MKSERAVAARLRAWRGFRDVAHATASLAGSLAVRWATHEQRAREHRERCRALAARAGTDAGAGPRVLVAFGTDLGLCGRLNVSVARRVREVVAETAPEACFVVGSRLVAALEGELPSFEHPAPASPEAVLELADRVLSEVRSALGADGGTPRLGCVHVDPGLREPRVDWEANLVPPRGRAPLLPPAEAAPAVAVELWAHARLVHAATLALLGEARVRQATMRRAQDTAERRIVEHEQALRRLHQERITQEMLEVLGGRRGPR